MPREQHWRIEPASPAEVEALSEIALRAKASWGDPEEWLEEWRPELTISPATLEEQTVRVARRRERIAGFYGLRVEGPVASLEHLWVDPPFHGFGCGGALFRHARAEARRRGCRELRIDSDPNAERFYLRMGAVRRSEVPAPVAGVDRWLPRLHLDLRTEKR